MPCTLCCHCLRGKTGYHFSAVSYSFHCIPLPKSIPGPPRSRRTTPTPSGSLFITLCVCPGRITFLFPWCKIGFNMCNLYSIVYVNNSPTCPNQNVLNFFMRNNLSSMSNRHIRVLTRTIRRDTTHDKQRIAQRHDKAAAAPPVGLLLLRDK